MKKIAIVFNEKNDMYEAHDYSLRFKLFGASTMTYITLSSDESDLLNNVSVIVKKRINGKYRLIRIIEI